MSFCKAVTISVQKKKKKTETKKAIRITAMAATDSQSEGGLGSEEEVTAGNSQDFRS
jgi:hypothetical protein